MLFTEKKINISNYEQALKVYNSNKEFLFHHLGKTSVDKSFIVNEVKEMEEHGFSSNLVYIDNEPIGILDYMILPSHDAYLSLVMLDSSMQHAGVGTNLYLYLERKLVDEGVKSIRIDVVNDYETNVIPFWEALGFLGQKETFLTWGEKTSKVLVMTKSLLNKKNTLEFAQITSIS